MDFAMNSLYLATISLKIVAYVKVTWNARYLVMILIPLSFISKRIKLLGKQWW